jgi:hypothetical protein
MLPHVSKCERTDETEQANLAVKAGLFERISAMRSNPMKTMQNCLGTCSHVPDEVRTAVLGSLRVIPEGSDNPEACNARAVVIALRMVVEGWQFCPCFQEGTTPQHAHIFGLVQTDFANSLARGATKQSGHAKKLRAA